MNLKWQWHARQIAKATLLLPISMTGFITATALIRIHKLYLFGFAMYPGMHWSQTNSTQELFQIFWAQTLSPIIFWYLLALPLDITVRRIVAHLDE